MKAPAFATNQNIGGMGTGTCKGAFQPPKNMTTDSTDIVTIATYSASMKKANFMPLYSVWKPAASVPSSSVRSNGILFISASPAMRNIANQTGPTGREKMVQFRELPDWLLTISAR